MPRSFPRRSRSITLVLLTSTAIGLGACDARPTQADFPVFRTVAQCGGYYETFQCERFDMQARAEHVRTAPRYATLSVCNDAHGADACGPEDPSATESASWYLPQMLGFIVTERDSAYTVKPVYASSRRERERQCQESGGTNCTQAKSSGGGGAHALLLMHYSTGGSYVGPAAANSAVSPARSFVSGSSGRAFSGSSGSAFSSVSGRGGFGGSAGVHGSVGA